MAKQQNDIYELQDGFYVGRMLKSGRMAAGAYKITGEDIMTMFTRLFDDCCRDSGQEKFIMKTGDGHLLVTTRVALKEEE